VAIKRIVLTLTGNMSLTEGRDVFVVRTSATKDSMSFWGDKS
jgi:hypothetical protein